MVAFSYRQICIAYPSGGGSYSVSKANFGRLASLVAASALMIDYVPDGRGLDLVGDRAGHRRRCRPSRAISVQVAIVAIFLIMIGNLRGLRESGNIFAIPTYLFVGSAFLMIAIGTFKIIVQGEGAAPTPAEVEAVSEYDAGRRLC